MTIAAEVIGIMDPLPACYDKSIMRNEKTAVPLNAKDPKLQYNRQKNWSMDVTRNFKVAVKT